MTAARAIARTIAAGLLLAMMALPAPALAARHSRSRQRHAAKRGANGTGGAGFGAAAGTATPPESAPINQGGSPPSGGASAPGGAPIVEEPTVPGATAVVIDGLAYAPTLAPPEVQRAIWAGDAIRFKPYIWGGGHGKWNAPGYDCSGSVSYLLHRAGLLRHPMDSSDLMRWGTAGAGQWITVYTDPAHAFIEIAGIRLDTSSEADPHPPAGTGPRWRPLYLHPRGFMARHPLGL